jgi:hypothetical protein
MSEVLRLRFAAAVTTLLILVATTGCKQDSGKVQVQGKVTFRGEPLERAAITFFPDSGRAESAAVENGSYTAELAPGNYTAVVLVSPTLPAGYKEGDKIPPPKVVLPVEYTSRMNSSLKPTVKPGQSDPINFDLK